MDAKAEVMSAGSSPTTRQTSAPATREGRPGEARATGPSRPAALHTSEDPMRRTDRYRLVMPYANRI